MTIIRNIENIEFTKEMIFGYTLPPYPFAHEKIIQDNERLHPTR